MSIALVMPSADFADNAMEQIIVTEPVPCTGITLDKSTGTIDTIGGTLSLLATITPTDTTDRIVWASSDTDVATVSNGTVTAVGVGTATITATCGNYLASCDVTISVQLVWDGKMLGAFPQGSGTATGGNGLGYAAETTNTRRGVIASLSGTLKLYRLVYDTQYYPIILPKGTKTLNISIDSAEKISLIKASYFSAQESAPSGYSDYAQLIATETWTDTNSIGIPTYDGLPEVDAIIICFSKATNPITAEDLDPSTINIECVGV